MSGTSPEPQPSASRNIYAFGLTSFFNDTATEMAYWVLPAFLVSLGAGPAQLGLIEGVAESVASFAKLIFRDGLRHHHIPRRAAHSFREAVAESDEKNVPPRSRHSKQWLHSVGHNISRNNQRLTAFEMVRNVSRKKLSERCHTFCDALNQTQLRRPCA